MAKKKGASLDNKLNYATLTVAETVAGNGKTEQFPTNLSAAERIGIEIHQIQYLFTGLGAILNAEAAQILTGICQIGTKIPDPSGEDDQISPNGTVHLCKLECTGTDLGAAAGQIDQDKFYDLSAAPPVVHPAALYGSVMTDNAGAVGKVHIRIGFRYVELTEQDYTDILQTVLYQNII